MLPLAPTSSAQMIYKKILAHTLTPLSAFEKLKGKFLLESACLQSGRGRYSLLVLTSAFMLIKELGQYFLLDETSRHDLSALDSTKDYLEWLAHFRSFAPDVQADFDFPLPLGGIGYLGFEFFSEIENITFHAPKRVAHYDCAFVFPREILVFDHLYDSAHLFCFSYAGESFVPTQQRLDSLCDLLQQNDVPQTSQIHHATIIDHEIPYKDFVRTIQDEIYQGNVMQCVPSRSLEVHTTLPPLAAYKNLRHENPSPYMFYCDFDDFILLGASPEIMVKLDDDKLTLRPIAGSCRRGADREEDRVLESQLLDNVKENAEHLMLVDLGRNDLAKVSKPGSVVVEKFKTLEKTARITHIASEISATLSADKTIRDILHATFPAGTVSGAPKIAAIELIARLETHARGFYAGCLGYIDHKNNLNSCITLRTALYRDGVYYLQAGGGIVYDSNPDEEQQEIHNKMRSLLYAITQGASEESLDVSSMRNMNDIAH